MSIREALSYKGIKGQRIGKFNQGINTTFIPYLVGDTLLDTGPPNQWREVRALLKQFQPKRVLLTHHHEDHSGNAGRLARTGLDVFAGRDTARILKKGFRVPFYRRVFWGQGEACECIELQGAFDAGQGLSLQPIAVPGHCDDMLCFLEPNRGWLFSADLYIASQPRHFIHGEDLAQQVASLQRVLEYDFKEMFCPHRGIVKQGREAVAKKLEYMQSLIAASQERYQHGDSIKAISKELLGPNDTIVYATLGNLSKTAFIRACVTLPTPVAE